MQVALDLASRAQMAELVDAPASGAGARKGVEVRVLFWAPFSCSALIANTRQTLGFLPYSATSWSLTVALVRQKPIKFGGLFGGLFWKGLDHGANRYCDQNRKAA